jgi:hypothetical protein
MSKENLSIWSQVEKTDFTHTKKVNQRGGYTAVSPQYQLKEATKVFGSYGKGFGLSESDFDMSLFESLGVVMHKAKFFYLSEGERVEFPITNAIQATTGAGDKKRVDVDFAKKVETNTVSKALSKLGFNADVFMGMFEDNQYMQELSNELAVKKSEDKDAELAKQAREYDDWKLKEIESYQHLSSLNALKNAYTAHIRKCQRVGDEQGVKQFTKVKDARKKELESNG